MTKSNDWLLAMGERHGHGHDPETGECWACPTCGSKDRGVRMHDPSRPKGHFACPNLAWHDQQDVCPRCGSTKAERGVRNHGKDVAWCSHEYHEDVEGVPGQPLVEGLASNDNSDREWSGRESDATRTPSTTSQHIAIVHNALWHAKQAGRVSVGPALASLDALERELAEAQEMVNGHLELNAKLVAENESLRQERNKANENLDMLIETYNAVIPERDKLRVERDRMREALEQIAAGPYNGFEQCKAIARQALQEETP